MITLVRRIAATVAVATSLALSGTAIAAAAPTTATTGAESPSTSASWQYYDWYYFKSDCQGRGRFLANEPILDKYDYWKCVYRGSWPFDYYDLYVK